MPWSDLWPEALRETKLHLEITHKSLLMYKQLHIVLSTEDKLNYLELPIPTTPVPTVAGQQVPPEILAAPPHGLKGKRKLLQLEAELSQYLSELLKNKKLSQGASTSGLGEAEVESRSFESVHGQWSTCSRQSYWIL
ncbi:hypothetical protein Tco_0177984 [Tanacetum coccineum]